MYEDEVMRSLTQDVEDVSSVFVIGDFSMSSEEQLSGYVGENRERHGCERRLVT